jgi:4-amino-4-deoxy-L-arabinose transferase-like glycosyltransferase
VIGMTTADSTLRRAWAAPSFQHVLIALIALTAIRIVGLYYSTVDLFFDEAQYWAWSRELAFGYFSKPPLLAWIIAGTDLVCGSGEACVRVASPLIHLGTCLVIYAVANHLYGQSAAAWSALVFALGTGLAFSARIISTDVPLLFFWAVALLAYLKLLPAPDWRWAAVLGMAIGFGLLAKYAMIYFVLCAVCAGLFDREARAVLTRRQTWLALAIAALIVSPNIYWNFANDFVTVRHTGDNITGGGLRLRPLDALAFISSQFAVAGPFVFATFVFILVRIRQSRLGREDRLMLAFAIPPFAIITALAFVRSANANWAAPGIVSMTILVVAWWLRHGHRRWLWATLAVGAVVQLLLIAGDANAYRVTVAALGSKADLYQRTLGWRPLGAQAAQLARAAGTPTVAAEGRGEVAALIYYLRNEPLTALSWSASAVPQHHFELTRALGNSAAEPVLFISFCPHPARLRRYYADVALLASITVDTGPSSTRRYHAFKLDKRRRDIGPLGPCTETAAP